MDHTNISALKVKVRNMEKELFALKAEVKKNERTIHGKIVIEPPNVYNCKSCFNGSCIFHPLMFRQKDFVAQIRAFTVLYGCLSWLPEDEKNV